MKGGHPKEPMSGRRGERNLPSKKGNRDSSQGKERKSLFDLGTVPKIRGESEGKKKYTERKMHPDSAARRAQSPKGKKQNKWAHLY